MPRASLLGLPPELKNIIYDLVLTQNDVINVNDNHSEPALLRKCRQIRKEARDIFLAQNVFELDIRNFDLKPQPRHWCWIRKPGTDLRTWWVGTLNWDNFLRYAKAFHSTSAPQLYGSVMDLDCWREPLCLRAFKIVKNGIKKKKVWEEVFEELEGLADMHLRADLY